MLACRLSCSNAIGDESRRRLHGTNDRIYTLDNGSPNLRSRGHGSSRSLYFRRHVSNDVAVHAALMLRDEIRSRAWIIALDVNRGVLAHAHIRLSKERPFPEPAIRHFACRVARFIPLQEIVSRARKVSSVHIF